MIIATFIDSIINTGLVDDGNLLDEKIVRITDIYSRNR